MKRIHKHFQGADPVMADLMRRHPLKPMKRNTENKFEYLALTILYQQLSTKVADVISKRFRALFNSEQFPEPRKILKVPDEKLRAVGISWAKVRYIKDLANKVHRGEVALDNLHAFTDEEVIAELTKVKGIGRWTAEMFLMSALGRSDIFSFGDLGLQTAIKKAYGFKGLPSKRTMQRLSSKWSPYRTYAARLLWASLDNE
jgi:DNA-3-methyladenine glycosylase II